MKKLLVFLVLSYFSLSSLLSQTQILIVGTAHDLPQGLESNYTPILEITKSWRPDLICTEFLVLNDTSSHIKSYGDTYFLKKDSVRASWNIQADGIRQRIDKLYLSLRKKDDIHKRMHLRNLLYVSHDRGNAEFQAFKIKKLYDVISKEEQGAFLNTFPMAEKMFENLSKGSTDEFSQVEYPLAIDLGIEYLHPTDDQSFRDLYHNNWEEGYKELEGSEILAEFYSFLNNFKSKMEGKMETDEMLLFVNNQENQEKLYQIEYSFVPVGLNEKKDLMSFYYMDRNYRMAMNILEVIKNNPDKKRIVVFYGVSHVPFIKKILRAETEHQILTLPDIDAYKEWVKNQ